MILGECGLRQLQPCAPPLPPQPEKLAERYPEIRILRTVPGVAPVIAAANVLTLNGSDEVAHSRSVGAFLGLRRRQS